MAACVVLAPALGAQPPSPEPLAVTHATAMDVRDGELMADHTVLVRGGRIAAVGPSGDVEVPDDEPGALGPGKRAHLLILADHPLEDIRDTRAFETVVLGGEVLDRSSLLPDERR